MLINECKPEFQFKKSSKNAKFRQCLYLVAHLCYEQNRCAERTVTVPTHVRPLKATALITTGSFVGRNLL